MKNVAPRRRAGKSTVGAVGTDRPTAPGEQAKGLPHGSNGRRWVDARGVALTSWLTLQPANEATWSWWQVVRVDRTGALGIEEITVLVDHCQSVKEAADELASWCEGLGLPCRDYGSTETFDPAGDPGWR
jgi:hypothetical protein